MKKTYPYYSTKTSSNNSQTCSERDTGGGMLNLTPNNNVKLGINTLPKHGFPLNLRANITISLDKELLTICGESPETQR